MAINTTLKHWLKVKRWQIRRLQVALRWGRQRLQTTPAVLGNAMPKSGSHLISQILKGLVNIGPFVDPGFPPVNRNEDNQKMSDETILENIQKMLPGDIAYGYIHARQPFVSPLIKSGRATIFIYRDPRDMIISHVFYATEIHEGHGMHAYYTQQLTSMEERIYAAIQGVKEPGAELSGVMEKYKNYLGWLDISQVLCLRFEDILLNRDPTLQKILEYLEQRGFQPTLPQENALEFLNQAIIPKKSGTFRKAQPGNWRDHFTAANKSQFKRYAPGLLECLGYEENDQW